MRISKMRTTKSGLRTWLLIFKVKSTNPFKLSPARSQGDLRLDAKFEDEARPLLGPHAGVPRQPAFGPRSLYHSVNCKGFAPPHSAGNVTKFAPDTASKLIKPR
jgi:hypothetical protein